MYINAEFPVLFIRVDNIYWVLDNIVNYSYKAF